MHYDNGYPKPGSPQRPVTLQVRQGEDGAQVVTLWLTRELAEAAGLSVESLRVRTDHAMYLDVDTDIMGAAVVPLASFELRLFED